MGTFGQTNSNTTFPAGGGEGGGGVGNGYALRFGAVDDPHGRGDNNVNCGQLYDQSTILTEKPFWLDGWSAPLANAYYYGRDGQGGAHAVMGGWDGGVGTLGLSGNFWNPDGGGGAGAVESFSSLDKVPAGTLHYSAFGWDGTTIKAFLDGVLTYRKAYSGRRQAGDGIWYWGSSDHLGFKGWLFRSRLFEGIIPFAAGLPANYFFPEQRFRTTFRDADGNPTIEAALNFDFTTPASQILNQGVGMGGRRNNGVLSVGQNYGNFFDGHIRDNLGALPIFELKAFEQSAYAGTAPSAIPAGATLFDEFRRQDITPAWYDASNKPANVAPTGQTWRTTGGILSEKLYVWENGIGDAVVVDSGATANMDVTFTNGNPEGDYADRPTYLFRSDATGANALVAVISLNSGSYDLTVGGTGTLGGSYYTATAALSTWKHNTVRVVANGNVVSVWVDGVKKIDAQSVLPASSGTRVGISGGALVRLDKIEARPA